MRVSSSLVRSALAEGRLEDAERLLGQSYRITGRVIHGAKLGRQIGFPTLNLRIGRQRRPAVHGIFAVHVHGLGKPVEGVASVGHRPTIDNSGQWLLEAHLFDFTQSVYGKRVQVEFLKKIRDEAKFDSLDALTIAIRQDAAQAREFFAARAASVPGTIGRHECGVRAEPRRAVPSG